METSTLVSPEEYLSTSYEPDVDYDEGELIERNVGMRPHSRLQTLLAHFVRNHEQEWTIIGLVEERIRVADRKIRVADFCGIRADAPKEDVITTPPLFVIEVVSPSDRLFRIEANAQLYLAMGVPYVWSVDPETITCWRHDTRRSMTAIEDCVLRVENSPIQIPVAHLIQSDPAWM